MSKQMRFLFLISLAAFIISGCSNTGPASDSNAGPSAGNDCGIKNVIIMIPDGCSTSIQTLARLYKGAELNLDQLNSGTVRTYAADSIITDSAAAVTAFATGHKTNIGTLGMGPKKENLLKGFEPTAKPFYPVANVLEGAKSKGMATGIIATNEICDATPGGFAAHTSSRRNFNDIMKQMVYQDIDLVFGGGGQYLLPEDSPTPFSGPDGGMVFGARTDSEDLTAVLEKRGYRFIMDREELSGIHDGRVWGIFSETKLSPEMLRNEYHPSQPSLVEMTEKALEILSKNDNGFLLVVEGSQVDWGGHSHDANYMVTEFLAFDDAVGKALEFAKKDDHTLLISFADHNTGGLALGNNNHKYNSYKMSADDMAGIYKRAKVTFYKLMELINQEKDITDKKLVDIFANNLGVSIDETQAKEILAMKKDFFGIVDYINNNIYAVGWTTYMHTADDVPLWSYASKCQCTPRGNINNSEIARIIAKGLGIDLKKTTDTLYVDAGGVFENYELLDTQNGPVLKIGDVLLPANEDIIKDGPETYRMDGIVIYSPEIKKFFIPEEAIKLISAKNQ